MLKISDLQSQVALNSQIIFDLEFKINVVMIDVQVLKHAKKRYNQDKDNINSELSDCYKAINLYKKKIKQYAKLQRALKDEIAYRIRFDRVMRELKVWEAQAKAEGFEIVVEE